MKNLLIYINPNGIDEKNDRLVKIQIDNSLEIGWKKEDILLITNFNYEHNGVKAFVVDGGFCYTKKECTKMSTIVHLFDIGFIEDGLYWCHDLDAFQLIPFTEEELELDGFDLGLCDYGRKITWQLGSMFFRKGAEDLLRENAARHKPGLDDKKRLIYDENIMMDMTDENFNNINSRSKRMNVTYDFGMRKINMCYKKAIKPLRVVHFDPESKKLNTLRIALHGENDLKRPLLDKKLIRLFKKYGYS